MRKLFVLMAAVAFVVAFTLPAAGEVSISGDAEMNLWFDSVSQEASATGYDDDDMSFSQDSSSKITFDFKNEVVGGKVEIRHGGGTVTVRHWYGTYKMGFGTLAVGQTYVPTDVSVEGPKRGWGSFRGGIDSSRQPMIALWTGGLKVALLPPNIGDDISGRTDTDTSLPAIEASYAFTLGPVGLTLFAGYNSYDEVNATDQSFSVDSMIYGGVVAFAAGPATIKATYYGADNPVEGKHEHDGGADMYPAYWDAATNTIKDASHMGYAASVHYKVSDTFSLVGGYGYEKSEQDRATTYEDESSAYFIYGIFSLAKGVSIAPEFGMLDHMDKTEGGIVTEQGDETWFGAEFKIKF